LPLPGGELFNGFHASGCRTAACATPMKIHSTVLAILHSPREKVWGQLLDLNPAGVTIHGLDLNAFDEWLKQWGSEEESGLATVFYPLHRVERMELDEPVGDLPSLEQRFQQRTHLTLAEYLSTRRQATKDGNE
jgi:hypothetical protein